jgi:hypothetical protein
MRLFPVKNLSSSKPAKAVISGIIPENSPKEPAWTFGTNRKKNLLPWQMFN